jgi:protein-S-isoprenylcysteine O-methyltransferase Ste14
MATSGGHDGAGDRDVPGIVVRPPLVYLSAILLGFAFQRLWPVAVVPQSARAPLGIPLVAVALILFVWAVSEFRRAGTGLRVREPATTVVRTGPYAFSRNPIYLAYTVLQGGVGIWAGNAWLLGLLVPAVALIISQVIAREERYLERKFGMDYLKYKASVRRWF